MNYVEIIVLLETYFSDIMDHEECRMKVCLVCLNERVQNKDKVEKLQPSDVLLVTKYVLPYDVDDPRYLCNI